ncbi:hypothetical protein DFJ73DRAFT_432685 [Zopfochytrium polystomum]|nr:hypothetical protein DFJ73DRAFT_432685 [Zopfochytrium polystomum]
MGRAATALAETLAWRKANGIDYILEEDFSAAEGTGKAQFFGRTREGHPILVLANRRHVCPREPVEREREVRYAAYLMEKARSEGVLTDKLVVVLDRYDSTNAQIDTSTFKAVASMLQKHYPRPAGAYDHLSDEHALLDGLEDGQGVFGCIHVAKGG